MKHLKLKASNISLKTTLRLSIFILLTSFFITSHIFAQTNTQDDTIEVRVLARDIDRLNERIEALQWRVNYLEEEMPSPLLYSTQSFLLLEQHLLY